LRAALSRAADYLASILDFRYMVVASSILFFGIIGLAFFMVFRNAEVMHQQINQDFNQQQGILARQAASQIDDILRDVRLELLTIKKVSHEAPDEVLDQTLQAALDRTGAKGVMEIGLVDESGRVVKRYDGQSPAAAFRAGLEKACAGEGEQEIKLRTLQMDEGPGGSIISGFLCTGFRLGGGGKGTLYARLDVSGLVAGVTGAIRSGKTGYAWVIDQDGIFLYHPEAQFVGKSAFVARKERKPYISFTQINQIMKERMLRGEQGTGIYVSGWHRGMEGEITKLIAYTPVQSPVLSESQIWSVAVVAPVSEVAEVVRRVYVRHFTAEAAIIAGMFVFGLLVAVYQNRMSKALAEKVKRTESDLHETERIYKRIVEQATDLIYIMDLEMRVVLLNRLAVETFSHLVVTESEGGVIPDEEDLTRMDLYIGRKLEELFPREDVEFIRKKIETVLEKRSSISYENTLRAGGRKLHLNTKLIPIRDDEGNIHYVLGISRDVTQKMEVDQKIYNTEKLASIGTLAAGVAHEINNPLGIILGFTDLLMERFPEGSPEKEDLKIIDYNANHAKKVVENLLGFARVTEGLEENVDLKQAIDTVLSIVKNTLLTKKIELVSEVQPDLPRVRGDAREIQQVIFNLINNSVAAMEGGGTIKITAVSNSEFVHMKVSDNGKGIPDKIKPRIFDPFFTTKKVGEGTGLGLSLCYGILKKYGGRITFESTAEEDAGEGAQTCTTFTVSLPIVSEKL